MFTTKYINTEPLAMINHDHKIGQFYYVSETLVSDNFDNGFKKLNVESIKEFEYYKINDDDINNFIIT